MEFEDDEEEEDLDETRDADENGVKTKKMVELERR